MTLQWTAVAVFLYAEIGFIILMMIPWIRPQMWSKLFKSRLVRSLEKYSYIFMYVGGGILVILFLDAIRDTRKYTAVDHQVDLTHVSGNADALVHMRLFRGQRNLYISGFAIFLSFVCRRMITLLVTEARLMATVDASLKQANSASAVAHKHMDKDSKRSKESIAKDDEKMKGVIADLHQSIKKVESEREDMREQAASVRKEYETLFDEYNRLDKVLQKTSDVRAKRE